MYCEGAFNTPNGKTAHGLVRRTRRYRVLSVIDSRHAGRDAGEVLDSRPAGIPVVPDLATAIADARSRSIAVDRLVVGLAPDGGRLPAEARRELLAAIEAGIGIDSGLHDFLAEDPEIAAAAEGRGVELRDVRRPPPRSALHFFSGKIEQVDCLKVALLGTDSAVGKRTTAWLLIDALAGAGYSAELVGTGQTAWMQGARYGIVLDSLVNDFVSGEIEHAVWSAWHGDVSGGARPDAIVIEGQGSLLNPAYPGGHEILAAGRPDVVVLQHAPARTAYDGFPAYPLHPLAQQIAAIETVSDKPVVAIALNREGLGAEGLAAAKAAIAAETGLAVCEPLSEGCAAVVEALSPWLEGRRPAGRRGGA